MSVMPAMGGSLTTASVAATFVAALLWPVIVTSLVGVCLWKATPKVSRTAHLTVWASLIAIVPVDLANASSTFRTLGVYTFLSM